MRTAVVQQHGVPPVAAERPVPTSAEDHALIAVAAAPITPLDVLCASGTPYFGAQPLPDIPGVHGVGLVREGSSVPAGTRVWSPPSPGCGRATAAWPSSQLRPPSS